MLSGHAIYNGELLEGARIGDAERVKNALANGPIYSGADPNCTDGARKTPLHLAAATGNLQIIQLLIEDYYANIESRDSHGNSPLHIAAARNEARVLQYLTETKEANVSASNMDGSTPLHVAVQAKSLNCTKALIEFEDVDLFAKDYAGKTPLMLSQAESEIRDLLISAIERRFLQIIDEGLIDVLINILETNCFADGVNRNVRVPTSGYNAMHLAASHDFTEMAQMLLDRVPNIDCNAQDREGNTPIHIAAKANFLDSVCFFKTVSECDISIRNLAGKTYLDLLTMDNQADMKRIESSFQKETLQSTVANLMAKHYTTKSVSFDEDMSGRNFGPELDPGWESGPELLMRFCRDGDLIGVKQCLSKGWIFSGVDPSCSDNHKVTPLHWATAAGHLPIVMHLIETYRVDPESRDETGRTPLHLAAKYNQVECAQYLVTQCRANIFARTEMLLTPLHIAAKYNKFEMVRFLSIDCKSFLWATDRYKEIPLGWPPQGSDAFSYLKGVSEAEFLRAVRQGDVTLLLTIANCRAFDKGLDINVRDKYGRTCLHSAVDKGYLTIANMLCKEPTINVNLRDRNGDTALHIATRNCDAAIVKFLVVDQNCDLMILDNQGQTAIDIAEGVVKAIFEDALNHSDSILLQACYVANMDAVLAALSPGQFVPGADPNAIDKDHDTCLHIAVRGGDFQLVRTLVCQFNAKPAELNKARKTPLCIAVDAMGHSGAMDQIVHLLMFQSPIGFKRHPLHKSSSIWNRRLQERRALDVLVGEPAEKCLRSVCLELIRSFLE